MLKIKTNQENGDSLVLITISEGITLAFQKLVDGRFDQVRKICFGKNDDGILSQKRPRWNAVFHYALWVLLHRKMTHGYVRWFEAYLEVKNCEKKVVETFLGLVWRKGAVIFESLMGLMGGKTALRN